MVAKKAPLKQRLKRLHSYKNRLYRNRRISAGSRLAEDIFNNFYYRRRKVYWLSFIRGIFFGFGSLLGGTVIVALTVWLLSQFIDLPGGVGEFVKNVINSMQNL